jgi:hypothetical protein
MIPKCFEKKANKVVGCVWGIEERKWGGDFRRRMMMFESLIEKSILMYGAEIWGWKEQEEVERVQENSIFQTKVRKCFLADRRQRLQTEP